MLTPEQIAKLTTPKRGPMTSRLPKKFAATNAKLVQPSLRSSNSDTIEGR